MGACCSGPAGQGDAPTPRTQNATQSSLAPQLRDSALDPGLRDTHEFQGRLGRGGTGEICQFKDKLTGQQVAIKLVRRPLPRIVSTNLLREILIQAELGEGHVNIVEAHEVMLTQHHLCLVMELAAGGTLMHHVSERHGRARHDLSAGLTEDEARYFFTQFIDAVDFCHANNVAHRDLKLDNTLLDGSRPPRVKLCDFGFAKDFKPGENMLTNIGTPTYMSPAQLHRHPSKVGYVGTAVDVWAAGVLLSVMLLGTFPFDHVENPDPNTRSAQMEVWAQQVHCRWHDVPAVRAVVGKLSQEVFDLLDRIFVVDEEHRITIMEIRRHPWFTRPPAPSFSAAAVKLQLEQRQLEQASLDQRGDQAKKAERAARIEDLIAASGLRPPRGGNAPTSPSVRIDLRRAAIVEGSVEGAQAAQPVADDLRPSKSLAAALTSLEQAEAAESMQQQQQQERDGEAAGSNPAAVPLEAAMGAPNHSAMMPDSVMNGSTSKLTPAAAASGGYGPGHLQFADRPALAVNGKQHTMGSANGTIGGAADIAAPTRRLSSAIEDRASV